MTTVSSQSQNRTNKFHFILTSSTIISYIVLSRLILSYPIFCVDKLQSGWNFIVYIKSDMVYGEEMNLGTDLGDKEGKIPLWDLMDKDSWKKLLFYTLQRYGRTHL